MRHAIPLLLALALVGGCHTTPSHPGRINHVVFFVLDDASQRDALIADCDALLTRIPGVVSYHCGTHLDTGRGDRVASDYDVGLAIGFDSEGAYAAYVEHPDHVRLVERWVPHLASLRVYDVLDED